MPQKWGCALLSALHPAASSVKPCHCWWVTRWSHWCPFVFDQYLWRGVPKLCVPASSFSSNLCSLALVWVSVTTPTWVNFYDVIAKCCFSMFMIPSPCISWYFIVRYNFPFTPIYFFVYLLSKDSWISALLSVLWFVTITIYRAVWIVPSLAGRSLFSLAPLPVYHVPIPFIVHFWQDNLFLVHPVLCLV